MVRGEWRRDEEMMGEISALGSMLPEAGVRSSPCSRSVRDHPRMLPARRVGFRLAFWCRRTTVASRLLDRDSDRCEYQSANTGGSTHPCVMLDVPRELGCLPLRFGHIRSISESVRPHRVVRIASSGPKSGWGRGVDPRMGPADRRLGGGRRSCRFARRASWLMPLRARTRGSPSPPSIARARQGARPARRANPRAKRPTAENASIRALLYGVFPSSAFDFGTLGHSV